LRVSGNILLNKRRKKENFRNIKTTRNIRINGKKRRNRNMEEFLILLIAQSIKY
jgi:hypothetical protein